MFMLILSTFVYGKNQHQISKVYYVESWKKGSQQIQVQKLTIELNASKREYETTVKDILGKDRYKLVINHSPLSKDGPQHESWDISLYEVKSKKALQTKSPNLNLLMIQKPVGRGDYFPIEDHIGWLYPVENPDFLKYGVAVYPFSAKRVIKVEGFYCIIKVSNYTLNQANPRTLDSLSIEIEFTNKLGE
jgi:hypothetical protein